jgi:hypothetical protein
LLDSASALGYVWGIVDDIFDRLGSLFKSMFQDSNDDSFGGTLHSSRSTGASRSTGDPDLDAAYDELNDFLNKDMSDSERRDRDAQRKAQNERSREYAQQRPGQGYSGAGPRQQTNPRPSAWPPQGLVNDYRVFELPVGTKLPEVKSSYKKILKEFHPDRHAGNPEMLKKATEYSAKVNDAYQRIEHYLDTGKYEA